MSSFTDQILKKRKVSNEHQKNEDSRPHSNITSNSFAVPNFIIKKATTASGNIINNHIVVNSNDTSRVPVMEQTNISNTMSSSNRSSSKSKNDTSNYITTNSTSTRRNNA